MWKQPRIRLRQDYGVTGYADATEGFLASVRRGGRPTMGCSIRRRVRQRRMPYPCVSVLFVQPVVNFILAQVHGCFSWQSFWKRGSERNGSQYGLSPRRAGVTLSCT
jgi:hypothetical protein